VDVELNEINGGSFSVTAAHRHSKIAINDEAIQKLAASEASGGDEALTAFRDRVFQQRDELRAFLDQCERDGKKLFGYGASTKGNVLLQFCEVSERQMPYIVEVNREKFGVFTPGTLIPIISEEEGRKLKPDLMLVLPWHFRTHIIGREAEFLKTGGALVFPLPKLEVVNPMKRAK